MSNRNPASSEARLESRSVPLNRKFPRLVPAPSLSPGGVVLAAGVALLIGGCGGGDSLLLPSEGEPSTIRVILGDGQSGRVGTRLGNPIVVRVTDETGRGVEGATVAFQLTSAGPNTEISPDTATTDPNGEASARIVLGSAMGVQSGEARLVAEGRIAQSAAFRVIALSENANSMAAVGGEDQTGHVNAPLDEPLVIQVTDAFGNPVPDKAITWEAQGGGTVSESSVTTDDEGKASVQRVLGPAAGVQTTVASSEGLAGSPVTFIHTALAGDAARLAIVSGDDQTGQVGSQLPAELVVRLIDGEGNGVPNTAVAWVVSTGGGSVTPASSNTDQEGRASARWSLGGSPGPNRLDAVVSGVGVVSFNATATPGTPAALSIVTQPSSSARNGIPIDRQPVIRLRDAGGRPATTAGVPVTAAIGAGAGTLSGTRQRLTDESGRATFTDLAISGSAGRYTLVFSAGGFASATSSDIDLRAVPTTTTILSDSPDPSAPGAPFTVEFRVTSEGATPDGTVTVTDGAEGCTGDLTGGRGSCQMALSTSGGRTLRATYAGGPGLSGSSDTESHTVAAAPPPPPPPPPGLTVTTITEDSPDPSVSGTTFTVRFTVTASGTTPEGSVRVTVSGGTPTCTGTLSGGAGSCQLTLNTVGDRTLTATYSGGPGLAGSADTEPHRVDQVPPQNREPFADFNWHCKGLTCSFTDASRDNDGTITSRHWDFGDGATADNQLSLSHTYAAEGRYRVTLTVTDNGGLSDDSDDNVNPKAPPPENQPPTASFTVTCTDLHCEFDDQSDDPDGNVERRSWTFGDGAGADNRDPKHDYAGTGTYTVTLIVTDNDGASGSTSQQVTVSAPPPPPPANTSTTITGDGPDPSAPGEAITVTFSVTSGSEAPDGDVVVTDPNGGSCSAPVAAGSCSLTPGGLGSRDLTATYQGTSRFAGSSDTEEHSVAEPPPPNQQPVASPDAYSVPQDGTLDVSAPGVLGNDNDDSSGLTAIGVAPASNGIVDLNPDGSFTYTPTIGFVGSDTFVYRASDGSLDSDPATVTINVGAAAPPP